MSLNWKIEQVIGLLQLISMSISNVKSAFRIANGISPGKCKFFSPSEDDAFEKPWSFSPGVTNFNMDYLIDPNMIPVTSRKRLLEKLNELRRS